MKITKQQLIEMIKEELKQTMEIKHHGYGEYDPWEGYEEEPEPTVNKTPRPKFMISYKNDEGKIVSVPAMISYKNDEGKIVSVPAESDEELTTSMRPHLDKGRSISVTQNWGKETGGSNEVGYAVPSPASEKRFGV